MTLRWFQLLLIGCLQRRAKETEACSKRSEYKIRWKVASGLCKDAYSTVHELLLRVEKFVCV